MGRKGDGDPGWLTLWRGWRKLSLLVCGYEMRIGWNVGKDESTPTQQNRADAMHQTERHSKTLLHNRAISFAKANPMAIILTEKGPPLVSPIPYATTPK